MLSLVGLVACGPAQVLFDWPATHGARSAVLVSTIDDRVDAIVGLDLTSGGNAVYFDTQPQDHVELVFLPLALDLGSIGLEDGRIAQAPDGVPLPMSSVIYLGVIEQGVATNWSEVSNLPGAVAAIRVPGIPEVPAPTVSVAVIELGEAGNTRSMARIDDARMLVLTTGPRFHVATATGATRSASLERLGYDVPAGAVFRQPDGPIWIAGAEGHLGRIDVSNGPLTYASVAPFGSIPVLHEVVALDGGGTGASFELFGVTDRGQVARYKDGEPTLYLDADEPASRHFSVARIAEGTAIVGGGFGRVDRIVVRTSSTATWLERVGEIVDASASQSTRAVTHDPTRGTFVALRTLGLFHVYHREGVDWVRLEHTVGPLGEVRDLLPLRDGPILYVSSSGVVGVANEARTVDHKLTTGAFVQVIGDGSGVWALEDPPAEQSPNGARLQRVTFDPPY